MGGHLINLRGRKSTWESALFIYEVMFEACGGGGGERLVLGAREALQRTALHPAEEGPKGLRR